MYKATVHEISTYKRPCILTGENGLLDKDTTHKLITMHFCKLDISVKSVSYVATQA